MPDQPKNIDNLIWFLSERAKELNCLYKIEGLLNKPDTNLDDICQGHHRGHPSRLAISGYLRREDHP